MNLMSFCMMFGTVTGAIAGATASTRVRMDLFGVVTCGTICALGGGTLRDLLLGHATPVFWVVDDGLCYLYYALITSFLTFFVTRVRKLPMGTVRIADAFTLALFTMIGTEKALGLGSSAAVAILMGLCTGVAGGVLRDLATGNVPYVFRPGELYATASFVGASCFILCLNIGWSQNVSYFVGLAIVFIVRMGAIWGHWSLPSYQPLFETLANEEVEMDEAPAPPKRN